MPASWGIVMTVDEPSDLVLANVAWHLGTGASEVHVFLDRPDDPLAPILAAIPGCRVTQCDAVYWQAKPGKSRPELQIRRQTVNANRALAKATVDWLVHLDADEFLWQARPLAEEMAALTGLSAELTFSVAERCYRREGAAVVAPDEAPFAGVFRRASQGNRGSTGRFTGRWSRCCRTACWGMRRENAQYRWARISFLRSIGRFAVFATRPTGRCNFLRPRRCCCILTG